MKRATYPFKVPIFMYSAASSGVNAPDDLSKSQNDTAIAPSTFRIKAANAGARPHQSEFVGVRTI